MVAMRWLEGTFENAWVAWFLVIVVLLFIISISSFGCRKCKYFRSVCSALNNIFFFFRLAVSKMSTSIVRMGCPRIGDATAAFLHHSERFSHHTCQSALLGKADRRTQFRRLCQSKSSRSRKPLTRASNVLSFVLIFDI